MDGIHIDNSYNIWSTSKMKKIILDYTKNPKEDINRTFVGMYIEWWIHNIGYYVTLPFIKMSTTLKRINTRLKHVDLESHKKEGK